MKVIKNKVDKKLNVNTAHALARDEDATDRAIFAASASVFAPVTVTYIHPVMVDYIMQDIWNFWKKKGMRHKA